MLNDGEMANFKRKKSWQYKKSRELKSSLRHWSYGRGIALEVTNRQEFKKWKYFKMKFGVDI